MMEDMKTGLVWRAPFTPAQVQALRDYQERYVIHPYTCGADSDHKPLGVVEAGWYCEDCAYTQDWAHPMQISLRQRLLAADLVAHTQIMDDGYASVIVHSGEEAVNRAMAAFKEWLEEEVMNA